MRTSFSFTVFGVVLGLAGYLFAPPVSAQEQIPGFNLPSIITPDDAASLSVDFDDAFNAISNPYLSDNIKLNYQISLLDKMVERQAQLDKIVESYAAMGLKFDQPAPPRGICAQLPANAPCLKHYPDLYDGLVSERKAFYAEQAVKNAVLANNPDIGPNGEPDPEAMARKKHAEEERKAREAKAERAGRYQWADVTCLGNVCRGVLTAPKKDGYRVTVRSGERLADGTLVQSISTHGIRVSIEGESIALRPAPADTAGSGTQSADSLGAAGDALARAGIAVPANAQIGPSSSAAGQAAAAAIIAHTGTAAGSVNTAGTNAVNAPAAPAGATPQAAGQTVAEPALGPSGLF